MLKQLKIMFYFVLLMIFYDSKPIMLIGLARKGQDYERFQKIYIHFL